MISYLLIRLITYPFAWMSFPMINRVGNGLGALLYYLLPKFRKRAHSNLALAKDLHLSNDEIRKIAKQSMQNLITTCLEYPKLSKTRKHVSEFVNFQPAVEVHDQGKGIIFFCGHQSNWELLFIEGTTQMKGVAIGRPIKNKYLYNWVLSIREKNGGRVVPPRNAIKEGLRALRKGEFLGVVGDQGMPDSGYSSSFFGRRAWTSPMPALLAYKTECPIIVATMHRDHGKHTVTFSNPIWPSQDEAQDREVDRMMRETLAVLEESVRKCPGQWLWSHNRWKQQTPHRLKRCYRYESIAIFLTEENMQEVIASLPQWREIYPHEFITLFVPKATDVPDSVDQIVYTSKEELLRPDYSYKLIFNFTPYKEVESHYKKYGAFNVVHWNHLPNLKETLLKPDAS